MKTKKIKTRKKEKARQLNRKKKTKVALILSVIAIALLVMNSLYIFLAKETILEQMQQSEQLAEFPEALEIVHYIVVALAIIWIILAIVMAYTTYLLENKKVSWGILLTEGIIAIVVGRIGSGIFAIIASIFYKKQKK